MSACFSLLLSLAAPPALASLEHELVHAPAHASTRRFEALVEEGYRGGQLEVVMNDQPVPSAFLPALDLRSDDTHRLEWVETRLSEPGAETALFLRRYEEAAWSNEGSMSMEAQGQAAEEQPWSVAADSPLVGQLLRCEADADGFEAEFADEAVRGVDLDELPADLGFAGLLPPEALAVGEGWEVEGERLAILFRFTEGLAYEIDAEAREQLGLEVDRIEVDGSLEFELREVRGALAHCRVEGELERVVERPGDLTPVPVVDGTATDTETTLWRVEGSFVWDLEAGALHALELEGETEQAIATVRDAGQPGPTYSSTFEVGGERRLSVSASAEDEALRPAR